MLNLKGCFTALVTPFENGRPDIKALRALVRRQAGAGVAGVVPCGSTGEAATLAPEEYLEVIAAVIEEAKGRLQVLPGVGTNSTARSAEAARKVSALGADGLLALVPYYNKPTQEGMVRHFSEMAAASSVPLVLYNIPGRTGVNMLPATVLEIAKRNPNVAGIKEASGSLDQVSELAGLLGPDFSIMSGDDSLTLPMMSVGARGVISVVSNLAPGEVSRMCAFFSAGDTAGAEKLHRRLFPLVKAMFTETNPIPVKYALSLLGLCGPEPRLPLTPISEKGAQTVRAALERFGLLPAA